MARSWMFSEILGILRQRLHGKKSSWSVCIYIYIYRDGSILWCYVLCSFYSIKDRAGFTARPSRRRLRRRRSSPWNLTLACGRRSQGWKPQRQACILYSVLTKTCVCRVCALSIFIHTCVYVCTHLPTSWNDPSLLGTLRSERGRLRSGWKPGAQETT